jgi:hypothetical protein
VQSSLFMKVKTGAGELRRDATPSTESRIDEL